MRPGAGPGSELLRWQDLDSNYLCLRVSGFMAPAFDPVLAATRNPAPETFFSSTCH